VVREPLMDGLSPVPLSPTLAARRHVAMLLNEGCPMPEVVAANEIRHDLAQRWDSGASDLDLATRSTGAGPSDQMATLFGGTNILLLGNEKRAILPLVASGSGSITDMATTYPR